MNKTIYMTYYKNIPNFVKERWIKLNNNYKIDFSLDSDCINFLEKNINNNVACMFKSIEQGMHKADLWRLCKLYINGGVYADVDLIPHLTIDKLDKNITFYSCLSAPVQYAPPGVFQAFIVNFSKPRNPLIFILLLSLLINKPYTKRTNGSTYDMYNCIQYMLPIQNIKPEIKYEIDEVKILVNIGKSEKNNKKINLYYFPEDIQYTIKLHRNFHNDKFHFEIKNNNLIVKRLDANTGWGHSHCIDICFHCKASVFFFPEHSGKDNRWQTSYVTFKNKKILDSRDMDYYNNGSKW